MNGKRWCYIGLVIIEALVFSAPRYHISRVPTTIIMAPHILEYNDFKGIANYIKSDECKNIALMVRLSLPSYNQNYSDRFGLSLARCR